MMYFRKGFSDIKFLSESHSFKFLLVLFLGIHIPLIGLIMFFRMGNSTLPLFTFVILAFVMTLISTIFTFIISRKFLIPIIKIENELKRYLKKEIIPNLKVSKTDKVSSVLLNAQKIIERQEKLLKQKDDLVALLAHDLRSPLYQTIALCEIIKTEENKENIAHYCDVLDQEMNKQLEFLLEILALLRQESVYLDTTNHKNINLYELLNDIVNSLKLSIKNKSIVVEITDFKQDMVMFAHPELVRQAFQNLMTNAIKFSHKNGRIMVQAAETGNRMLQIKFKDDGIGFLPQNSTNIFDRFTQIRQMGTNGEGSVGLGLYLTKNIIEQHNGKIEASSEGKDKGATFTITLQKSMTQEA
jgi:signal transduction histidine kinase